MTLIAHLRHLWRLSGFRRLTYTRVLSQAGDGMFQVGIATAFFFEPTQAATASDIAIGFAVLLAPFTLVGPFVGPLIDRWRRQRIILIGNLVRLVLAAGIGFTLYFDGPLPVLYAMALLTLSINRFLLAAMAAGIPRVVPREELLTANSVLPTLGTLAAVVGAAIGALVTFLVPGITDASVALTALLCAGATFGLSSWSITLLTARQLGPLDALQSVPLREQFVELLVRLKEGAVYLHDRVTPFHALLVMAAQRLLYGLMFVAAILISRHVLADSTSTEGALGEFTGVLAFAAIGFGIAAILTPAFGDRCSRHQWIIACLIVGAAGHVILTISAQRWALLSAAVIVSFAVQGAKIAVDTIVQRDTHDFVRGRAFTLYDMAFNVAFVSSAAIGALVLPDSGYSRLVMGSLVIIYVLVALIYARAPQVPREIPGDTHERVDS